MLIPPVFTILLKMPAILADIATAFLIFLIVRKYGSFRLAFIAMISYAFNPAIIYNSAIWGRWILFTPCFSCWP